MYNRIEHCILFICTLYTLVDCRRYKQIALSGDIIDKQTSVSLFQPFSLFSPLPPLHKPAHSPVQHIEPLQTILSNRSSNDSPQEIHQTTKPARVDAPRRSKTTHVTIPNSPNPGTTQIHPRCANQSKSKFGVIYSHLRTHAGPTVRCGQAPG